MPEQRCDDLISAIKGMIAFARLQNPQAFDGEVRIASTLATRQALIDCRRKQYPHEEIPVHALEIKHFSGHYCEWYHTDEGALFSSLLNQDGVVSYIFIPTPKSVKQVGKG